MEFAEFTAVVETARKENPILFSLGHDAIPAPEAAAEFERQNRIKLPEKYVQFLLAYGGGYFGFSNVYSLDETSDFYLLKHNKMPLESIFRVGDNGWGDYYAFRVDGGTCSEELYFQDHEAGKVSGTGYGDILECLIKVGLKQKRGT